MTSQVDHSIQLGTLVIDLPAGSPIAPEGWTVNQQTIWGFLDRTPWPEDSSSLIDSLKHLSADEGVRLQLELKRAEESQYLAVLIRCKILPSDAPRTGAAWRTPGKQRHDRHKYLYRLFDRLYDGWDENGERLMGTRPSDRLSMPEIWSQIPSPPEPRFPSSRWAAEEEVYRRLENLEEPVGIKTRMYQYQFRSVSQMLQMETNPERLVDPLLTPFKESGREGTYWVRLDTWDIQRQPAWYDLPRGGVLCEQMGVGKTLMCLSLILATLHQPPSPPPTALHITPLVTDVAMASYPFKKYKDLRQLVGYPRPTSEALQRPTLSQLCADVLAKHDHSARLRSDVPPHIAENTDRQTFYYDVPYVDDCMRAVKRRNLILETKKFYLAKTTLVVVPPILVPQWMNEIGKHVEEGALKVLVANKEDLPPIEELIKYDVILMNVNRFGMEENIRRTMQDLEPSVLLRARWKRIILDEGHVAATKTTNAMRMAMSLSCERRWIVSGTPTRHLQQGGEAEIASLGLPLDVESVDLAEAKVDIDAKPKSWPRNDLEDVTRIGVMVGGFLAAEPFKSDAAFQELVTAPLRHRHGPRFGSIRRLKYLMDAMMVKHRPGEIDTQALLPPSTLIAESLRFEPMQRVTYNVLAALVASNVYTSNFTDVDYFLHPRNLDSFLQVVRNLHLACFWYSAREMDIQGCIDRTHKHIESNASLSDEHRERLKEAVYHMERALAMPGWDEWMSNGVSVPFEAPFVPEPIRQAWSDTFETDDTMIDADSLLCLRRANIPGKDADRLKMEGWDTRARKSKWFEEEMAKKEVHHNRIHGKKSVGESERGKGGTAASQPRNLSKEGSILKKSTVKDAPPRRSKKRKADELDGLLDVASHNAAAQASTARPEPVGPRLLPDTISTKSKCAKVNFVIDTILSSDPSDKFVIFGDTFELGHLTEALDLFDVKLCFAGHTVSDAKRTEALQEFQDPAVRVCLLDLRLAARGLNLVAANRMIFLAPVWSRDVQAQAIKRVHRIGQTRPTKVQILVTEGTFEEDILKRYSAQKSDDDEKLYSRAMIENPKFVHIEHESQKTFQARFTPTKPKPIIQEEVPDIPVTPEAGPSRVRFASAQPSETTEASSPAELPLVTPREAIYSEVPSTSHSPIPAGRVLFSSVKDESVDDEDEEERIGRLMDGFNTDEEDMDGDEDVKPAVPLLPSDRPFKRLRVA